VTVQEARKYGQRLILKGTAIILLILIFLLLLGETRGDFANGVLFFLTGLFNLYSILGFVLLFFLSAFCGRKAGEEIVIEKQGVFIVSAKYSILISLTIAVYVTIVAIFNRDLYNSADIGSLIATSFLPMFLKTLLFIFLIWIWAGNRMKRKV
jgi:hypothetical protein